GCSQFHSKFNLLMERQSGHSYQNLLQSVMSPDSPSVVLVLSFLPVPRSFKQQLATFCPSIYYISSAVATWGESRNDCLKRGADLVIINSRDEQDFLTWYKKRLWIGLTDAEKEGEWKWVDGTRISRLQSLSGPANIVINFDLGTNEDCGEMRFSESENNWNDVPCGIKNSWICERKLQISWK
uniref:C-type lectin domain-containing protein n=1 Tax=Poecilia mexicana TaxID=48701 RepID=A0A3B3X1Y4_9TELE